MPNQSLNGSDKQLNHNNQYNTVSELSLPSYQLGQWRIEMVYIALSFRIDIKSLCALSCNEIWFKSIDPESGRFSCLW